MERNLGAIVVTASGWLRTRALRGWRRVRALAAERSSRTLAAVAGLGWAIGAAGVLAFAISIFVGLPGVTNAESLWALNRQPGVTFVDTAGAVIGVRGPSYGRRVTIAELPSYVPAAFLAIEDQRFYRHDGVDEQALARAAAVNFTSGATVQGGSTITQQLVKNLFLTPDRTLRRKLQEIILARRVERKLKKNEILELYLNRVFLGENAFGVDAAARRYFGKPATQLKLEEAAMLAGLPKAPSSYAPSQNFERAKARQLLVLRTMRESRVITRQESEAAAAAPIRIQKRKSEEAGLGYVFDAAMEEARARSADLPADLLVQITIDQKLQRAAANAVTTQLGKRAQAKNPLQAALVSMDETGAIRALIGGSSYQASKFNRVTQAKRQPGSSFKLFVFAAALEAGLSPETVRVDAPITIRGWSPGNYHQSYEGAVTLSTAFAKSLNTVAAQVAEDIGQERVVTLAHRLGLRSKMLPLPAIALGVTEATPLEMTNAYSVFMRGGDMTPSFLVQRLSDSRGQITYDHEAAPSVPVVDPNIVLAMNSMLVRVVQAGTGTRARIPGYEAAGKTGTSQEYRDAWFIGFTNQYTTGVWVGHDDFKPTANITGGTIPAAIWAQYMVQAQSGKPSTPIPRADDTLLDDREAETERFQAALSRALRGSAS